MKGKMCANVFTNNWMGEGVGINDLQIGLHVSTNFGQ